MIKLVFLFALVFLNFSSYASENLDTISGASNKKRKLSLTEESSKNPKTFITNVHNLSASDVASIFLILDKKERSTNPKLPPFDKLKLHKMCYYANGFALGLTGRPLFKEPIYAYTHGPFLGEAVEVVYPNCKENNPHYNLEWKGEDNLSSYPYNEDEFTKIKTVYELKKELTGTDLKKASHTEKPWVETYKSDQLPGSSIAISENLIKDFFSEPQQMSSYLKKNLELASVPEILTLLLQTKKWVQEIHNLKQIISLNDYLLDILKSRSLKYNEKIELIDLLSKNVDELINTTSEDFARSLTGYLFFPSELTEGYTPLQTMFLNLSLHRKLAYAAKYDHPVAQEFSTKLLKDSGEEEEENIRSTIQELKNKSKKVYLNISKEKSGVHSYFRGLAFQRLKHEKEAKSQFQEGAKQGHALSLYALASMKEADRDYDDAFKDYEKSFNQGYLKALLGMGTCAADPKTAFNCFSEAGSYGLGEGYFLLAKMIKEEEKSEEDYINYLKLAAKNNSISALMTLGDFYEKKGKLIEAKKTYEELANRGNINGFINQGRILENCQSYDEAKQLYKHESAGWLGLYTLAQTCPKSEQKLIKDQALKKRKLHYQEFSQIVNNSDD